jgi:hypothetical protein
MTERHAITSAAVADDVVVPVEPRAREARLLTFLAITAVLVPVGMRAAVGATRIVDLSGDEVQHMLTLFIIVTVVVKIAAIAVIALLATLDGIAAGLDQKRRRAIAFAVVELLMTFFPTVALLNWIGDAAFTLMQIPVFLAQLMMALWLAAMLKAHGKKPMLVVATLAALVLALVPLPMSFSVDRALFILVKILAAIEVMRVRRAL